MTGTLALVGGGEWQPGCTFDSDLLAAAPAREVLVMATAAAYEAPSLHEARAVEHLSRLGATVQVTPVYGRGDALVDENVKAVRETGFVYMCGGASLHAVSVLKATPLWEALLAAWSEGAVVAASDGAARALCDPMVDPRGGAFTVGLGLLAGVAFVPDRGGWSADRAHRTRLLAPRGLPLVVVDASTAVIRDRQGKWSVAGAGGASVFVNAHEADLDALP